MTEGIPVAKPLIDRTDDEVRRLLRDVAAHVSYNYNDVIAELDRRAANRAARASNRLSAVSVIIAVVAILITALRT